MTELMKAVEHFLTLESLAATEERCDYLLQYLAERKKAIVRLRAEFEASKASQSA